MPATAAEVIRDIHAAAMDAARWPQAIDGLRQRLGAHRAMLVRHAFDSGRDDVIVQCPADPQFTRDLADFTARNPWYLSTDAYTAGRVIPGDELLRQDDLLRTDFYRGVLQPRGLQHRLCGVIRRSAEAAHVLIAYRSAESGDFGADEQTELQATLEHLGLSLECQWRLQEADDLAQTMQALTERESHPVFLVDGAGEPVYRNQAAQRLLDRAEGLFLDDTRLAACHSADRRVLREAIAQMAARAMDEGPELAGPRVVTLAPAAGGPPVVVVVRVAGAAWSRKAGERRGLALVSVRGAATSHDPAHCSFARQYELTAAQAKVSSLVFAGQSLSAIAQSLCVSENTVRSHLKVVFQKTDTHGQMDLVHLHARVCTS